MVWNLLFSQQQRHIKDAFVVRSPNVSPPVFFFCVPPEPHVDSAQQLTWARSAPAAENKDPMMQRIISGHQLPSVELATDRLALNFWFSHATRNPTNGKKKEKQSKRGGKNQRNGGKRTLKDPLPPFFTDHYFKSIRKANLFVHRILYVFA